MTVNFTIFKPKQVTWSDHIEHPTSYEIIMAFQKRYRKPKARLSITRHLEPPHAHIYRGDKVIASVEILV